MNQKTSQKTNKNKKDPAITESQEGTSISTLPEKKVAVKQITPEMLAKLKAPLPQEAVSPHPTKPYLSTIKVIYVTERLNDVFGLAGWHVNNEVVESQGEMVVVKSTFTASEYGIEIEQFGGNDNKDRGDAYKGACTDALSKIGSYLYIGMDVYKGLADKSNKASLSNMQDNLPSSKQVSSLSPLKRSKSYLPAANTPDQLVTKYSQQIKKAIGPADLDIIASKVRQEYTDKKLEARHLKELSLISQARRKEVEKDPIDLGSPEVPIK